MLVTNYRMESVGLRVFDPNRKGPDGKHGTQAPGQRGDLAFALQSRTDRAIAQLNVQPTAATVINGTRFPPPINAARRSAGDPFTPMMRTYPGDLIRVKMQAGAHEEEHNESHPRHEVAAGRLGPRQVAELRLEELAGRGHLRAVHAHARR